MYVALRDLRFARGRFTLIAGVVALITVLVGFLSGLTAGLASQNVSAVLGLPADRIVLAAGADGGEPTFSDSALSPAQVEAWQSADGVTRAEPVGVAQARAEGPAGQAAVAVLGVAPGLDAASPTTPGHVGMSEAAAQALGVAAGEQASLLGKVWDVEVVAGDWWYSHLPVVQLTLDDWRALPAPVGTEQPHATLLAVEGDVDWAAVSGRTGTVAEAPLTSLLSLEAFRSEVGSLLLMVALLFGIAALVIGAFFTVWTMQRQGDVAVLKALGASTGSLVRDALGQALVVLVVGIGTGFAVVLAAGAVVGEALPFVVSPLTTLAPGLAMALLGLAGAAFALRSVTAADPLTALGSNR